MISRCVWTLWCCALPLFVDDSIIRLRSNDFNVNPKWMKSIYIRLSQYPIPWRRGLHFRISKTNKPPHCWEYKPLSYCVWSVSTFWTAWMSWGGGDYGFKHIKLCSNNEVPTCRLHSNQVLVCRATTTKGSLGHLATFWGTSSTYNDLSLILKIWMK